jgi:hypothetical protein
MAQYGLMDRNYRLKVHFISFFFSKMLLWFVPDGISPLTIELPHKKLAQKT